MEFSSPFAEQTARFLLEIEAAQIKPDTPFTLTSGKKSPVYVDCRRIISFPLVRSWLMDSAITYFESQKQSFDLIAGGETAGIPFAAFLAERLNLPMVYVRKKPKGFGKGSQIEGHFEKGQRVLLVEDMATDGGSKLLFSKPLQEAGLTCDQCFVVFQYGIFPEKVKQLEEQGLSLHSLANWWDLLYLLKKEEKLSPSQVESVTGFLNNPQDWQDKHST